jgi:hypothetical protein|uniref:Putative zinc-or iron-chelating protein n=1 Tax=viral metagenome TaxID=1070528 RepID=A0A6M3LII1_9ZZZZ
MKRTGKCKKCGNCCRQLKFFFPEGLLKNREFVEFYEARGCEVKQSERMEGHIMVMIPFPCPHLKGDLCGIQNRKPRACRNAPVNPWDHEGLDCGFKWKGEDA